MSFLATRDWLDWYAPGTEPVITEELKQQLQLQSKKLATNYFSWRDDLFWRVLDDRARSSEGRF